MENNPLAFKNEPKALLWIWGLGLAMAIVGFFFSRALYSVSLFPLMVTVIFLFRQHTFSFHQKELLVLLTVLALTLCYGLGSIMPGPDGMKYWLIRLPLLVWIALALLVGNSHLGYKTIVELLLVLWLFCLCISSAWTAIQVITDYEQIITRYRYGQVMPLVINHIRYSLALASGAYFSFAAAWYFRFDKIRLKAYGFIGILLFALLHILSVRTGIVSFYLAGLVTLVLLFLTVPKYRHWLWFSPVILALPIMMYFFLPTIQNKVSYMVEDLSSLFNNKNVGYYSDANRLISLAGAVELGWQNPWTGVGSGHLKGEMDQYYANNYPNIEPARRLLPHNEWLFSFAAFGFPGLFLSIAFSFVPLYYFIRKKWYLSIGIQLMIILSCLVEATFSTQLGVAYYGISLALATGLDAQWLWPSQQKSPA